MECPKCKVPNPDEKKFCGECGASLDPVAMAVDAYLSSTLRMQIQSIIKEELKDQNVMEVELSANVAERLSGWLKLFAFFVGIPVGLFVIFLGFLGVDKYQDFRAKLEKVTSEVVAKVEGSKKNIEEAGKVAGDLKVKVTAASEQSARDADDMAKRASELRRKFQDMSAQLDQIPKLKSQVNTLQQTVDMRSVSARIFVLVRDANLAEINRVLKAIGAPKSDFTVFSEAAEALETAFRDAGPGDVQKWKRAFGL
jgi:hypothetical protein